MYNFLTHQTISFGRKIKVIRASLVTFAFKMTVSYTEGRVHEDEKQTYVYKRNLLRCT
jgi:hypothetical protein